MIPTGQDSLHTRSTLDVGGKTYAYYSLTKAAGALGDVSRLPFSMKMLLENLLRFEDGATVTRDDLQAMADWLKERRINREIQYRPARVLMQDFTGVPAVVDLAAMRDARPAGQHADPRGGRVPPRRPAQGGDHGARPRADSDTNVASERRGRPVCRILRARPRQSAARRPGDDRQHGARIWSDLRLLPDRRADDRLFAADRPRRARDCARPCLRAGAGPVAR